MGQYQCKTSCVFELGLKQRPHTVLTTGARCDRDSNLGSHSWEPSDLLLSYSPPLL